MKLKNKTYILIKKRDIQELMTLLGKLIYVNQRFKIALNKQNLSITFM